jgi:hypothetical protein
MVICYGQRYSTEEILREGVWEGWEFRVLARAENISNLPLSTLHSAGLDLLVQTGGSVE